MNYKECSNFDKVQKEVLEWKNDDFRLSLKYCIISHCRKMYECLKECYEEKNRQEFKKIIS